MLGNVTADGAEPRLAVVVLGTSPAGSDAGSSTQYDRFEVQAVVDTGFDGALQLPPEVVRRLGHPYEGSTRGTLADGGEAWFDYHTGKVLWHGAKRDVVVIASDGDPLLGMALLGGSRLTVDAEPGGAVRVDELRPVGADPTA